MSELLACLQVGSPLRVALALCVLLSLLWLATTGWLRRSARHGRRMRRLEWAERQWARGRWVYLTDDGDTVRVYSCALMPDCLEPRGTEIPVAFRQAFGGE